MKTKNVLLTLLTLVMFIACKEDKNTESEEVVMVEVPKETFNVAFDLVIKQDDSLQLYYKDESMSDWAFDKCVTSVIKGSDNTQQIKFSLPEDVLPTELRFDLGSNKDQKEIEIKNFKMEYFEKSFEVKDTLFFQYFYPNDQIDYNRAKAIAKPIIIDNKVYDPIFISRPVLTDQMNKLYK